MGKFLTIDRIEEGIAVIEQEDLSTFTLPLASLPQGVREGSVLILNDGVYTIDISEEKRRREYNLELQDSLFDKI